MSPNSVSDGVHPATPESPVRLGRAFIQDPHTCYRTLNAEAPAHRVTIWGATHAWLITRYAEARVLLADPRLSKNWQGLAELLPQEDHTAHKSSLNNHMLQQDPPEHTRLRKLLTKEFTAGSVRRMRPDIVGIADALLDGVAQAADGDTVVDLMQAYAIRLPLGVIGKLLGVPPDDRDRFRLLCEPLLTSIDHAALTSSENALIELLTGLIASKRTAPADDLLSALVNASDVDDRLGEDELLATAYLLILAGYETTVNLIGNGVLALLRNPSQLAALRADPGILPSAVEEFLRFESPLNTATLRYTTSAVRVGEVEIPARQLVLIALLGANHDGRQFDKPDVLDVTRTPNPHVAFGHGIHHCLGAPLARLEGEIGIGRLLDRFERITLADNVVLQYRNSTLMHGLAALPVRLRERR
ncbi:cytochrome P450 family protein [Mycobacterium simiae]|uniref:cytochrome P450 family protein n=1 Tax=Mycobacterium simiae TaxID=1784 RepID=UPI0020CAB1C3|nr:cytochrome P450 [Mycobacterium simiae]